jgi:hydrogenase nickel incorporation protein HypB
MCQECGCSHPGSYRVGQKIFRGHEHAHTLPDGTMITHAHGHHHDQGQCHDRVHQVLNLEIGVLNANDRVAEQNRVTFKAFKQLVINVVASPGAGKTTLLTQTIIELKARLRCGVIVGDLATDNDAVRLRTTGAPVVQIATGTLCHLEASMVAQAMQQLDLPALELLMIENVGNLVCPASFDLGETLRVVAHSVTEGEDKPLKYPPMFQSADVIIITKIDLAVAAGFEREIALQNIRRAAPRAKVFEVAAKTGAGMKDWCDFLVGQHAARKQTE